MQSVLYLDWPCFSKNDVLHAFENMNLTVYPFFHKDYQARKSAEFEAAFDHFAEEHEIDFCFSYNYFPVLSEAAKKHNIRYVSIIYDSPYVMLYSYTLINPNNYVFLFDKEPYLELKKAGIETVYYMPLPVNAVKIDRLLTQPYNQEKLSADVSFVGSLYNEDHNFFERLAGANEYLKGYLNGIMDAQLKVSGYNFIEETLTPHIIDALQKVCPYENDRYGVETPSYIYANYFINRKLTAMERHTLLTLVAENYPLKLFTRNLSADIPGADNLGTVDYYNEMPYVFHNSKINLNITLRSIKSGIPLRAMDIMGAGGFLLTNFQADFLDYFVPDEDYVYYEDEHDMLRKIDYYLSHEEKRAEIARNGHAKVKEHHSFEKCFETIFNIIS